MKRRNLCLALPLLVVAMHPPSSADPMRPLVLPVAASAASPAGATAAVAAERGLRPREAGAPEPPKEPERLVAIRQDSASRWLALFGERWVTSGDRVEHYTVGAIDGNSVQLADGKQRRTLHLLPPLLAPHLAPAAAQTPNATPRPPVPVQGQPPLSRLHESAQTQTAALSPHRADGSSTP
jgi:hypothetical protein